MNLTGYYIQEFEVTNGELEAFERDHHGAVAEQELEPWREQFKSVAHTLDSGTAANHPATRIPWLVAAEFARRHNAHLPSEAQWEFAARSRDSDRLLVWSPADDAKHQCNQLANLDAVVDRNGVWTTEVGAFHEHDCTLQGVKDMAGNVREWCRDLMQPYDASEATDPTSPPDRKLTRSLVVVRGGSFLQNSETRFVSHRGNGLPLSDDKPVPFDVGFRLVLECPEVSMVAAP